MMKIFLCALLLLPTRPALAIELSLEENRAERGSIGYIDIKRVFQLFPETQRAKDAFEETVRQTEEQVNLRKAELLRLRAELSRMKADREVLAAVPPAPPPPPKVPAAHKAAAPAPEKSGPKPLVASSSASAIAGLPGFSGVSSAAAHEPLLAALPEAATSALLLDEPPMVAPAQTPLQMIDERIAQKTAEIAQKEGEYKKQLADAEKNLLDLESRKSEVLLGKIYKALQEVARQEGVGVIVDKSAILYGHAAVDLTDKVLKRLKGT